MSSFANSNSNSNSNSAKSKIIKYSDWNPKLNKYMPAKVNDKGGKSITLISKQTNRALHLDTPMMMTWGISDFCDDQGVSDNKYKISINFPNPEYKTAETDIMLKKMIEFQEQILDDAVENSELWWGEKMSRELVKHTFFPFLKFRKNKDTNKIDYTSAPSFSAKVPYYKDTEQWAVELYDLNSNMIFPCDDTSLNPSDFVPKMSQVACLIQCTGLWIGGKGWGLTWKLVQAVVKPKENESIRGKCQISISANDMKPIVEEDEEVVTDYGYHEHEVKKVPVDTTVEDSDEETDVDVPVVPEPVDVSEPEPEPVKVKPVASVFAKKPVVVAASAAAPVSEPPAASAPKVVKKVVKKKVTA